MERSPNCCALASLVAVVIFLLFPVRSGGQEEASPTEAKVECCVRDIAELKRFNGIDYDSFVGLMGRRSAAQPNSHRNTPMSRKRQMDHILAGLLGPRTGMTCPCAEEYLQTRRGQFINHGWQRFQRFLK